MSAVGIVIQARMSSARLPGKVLADLAGKPMLGWLVDRMQSIGSVPVIVATSIDETDDAVASYVAARGVRCFRGPLDNVLERYAGACRKFGLEAVVRVNGDSPFLDPALVQRALDLFAASDVDLVTNVFPRSFPKGQSVEVVRAAALDAISGDAGASEKEHVTARFYSQPERYRILNFSAPSSHADVQMSVDTAHDLDIARRMVLSASKPIADHGVEELVRLHTMARLAAAASC
jgi:spore coat polysaccharide biosynthesis protein SpsF